MTGCKDRRYYRDQVAYSVQSVEFYIPACFDEDWTPPPQGGAPAGVKTKRDPRHIPEALIGKADVVLGFRRARLSDAEKSCIEHIDHLGYSAAELSDHWGVTPEQIHTTRREGLERIADYISGRTPK